MFFTEWLTHIVKRSMCNLMGLKPTLLLHFSVTRFGNFSDPFRGFKKGAWQQLLQLFGHVISTFLWGAQPTAPWICRPPACCGWSSAASCDCESHKIGLFLAERMFFLYFYYSGYFAPYHNNQFTVAFNLSEYFKYYNSEGVITCKVNDIFPKIIKYNCDSLLWMFFHPLSSTNLSAYLDKSKCMGE